jgi:hypothetical protein
MAATLPGLVSARILQGLGGAMMVPVGRLLLLRSVESSELVNALSFLTVPALLGPVAGRSSAASLPPISIGAGFSGSMCRLERLVSYSPRFLSRTSNPKLFGPSMSLGFFSAVPGLRCFCSGLAAPGAAYCPGKPRSPWQALALALWPLTAVMPGSQLFHYST